MNEAQFKRDTLYFLLRNFWAIVILSVVLLLTLFRKSLYTFYKKIRSKEYEVSLSFLNIRGEVLYTGVLSKWRPLLGVYESSKPEKLLQYSHEKEWNKNEAFGNEMAQLKPALINIGVLKKYY